MSKLNQDNMQSVIPTIYTSPKRENYLQEKTPKVKVRVVKNRLQLSGPIKTCCPTNSHFDLFKFGNNSIKLAKTSNKQSPGDELAIVSGPLISFNSRELWLTQTRRSNKMPNWAILNKCVLGA